MFQRKVSVQYKAEGRLQPCPMKWLDNFAMRNFTNDPMFDDTLPVADGWLELGARVSLVRLQAAMEAWFRKKSYLGKEDALVIKEEAVKEEAVKVETPGGKSR